MWTHIVHRYLSRSRYHQNLRTFSKPGEYQIYRLMHYYQKENTPKKKQEINAQKLNHERNTICRLRVSGVQSGVTKLKVVYICVTVSIYE